MSEQLVESREPVTIRVVGPIQYVHRAGCAANPAGYQCLTTDDRIWRCITCGVRVGTYLNMPAGIMSDDETRYMLGTRPIEDFS